MPWNNQSGGGGGPWKPSNPSPWGQGSGGGGGFGGNKPPELEDFLRRGQDRLKRAIPPGGAASAKGLVALALLGAAVWLGFGLYTVQTNEVGLNMVFGRFVGKTQPGLNYNFPYPIGSVVKLKVTDQNFIDVGSRFQSERMRANAENAIDVPEESLMLTGDENIADLKFRVVWQIDPAAPENFAFNIRNPVDTIKAVAESSMREIVGRTPIQRILTAERKVIEPTARDLMQKILNDYGAGVLIQQVQLLSVDPPSQVISAFRDVTAAQQDMQRLRNEAETYANRVVPEARGQASRIVLGADAFKLQTVAEAQGQASRFQQVYEQYKRAPDVTRERIYLETMERVLGRVDKIILDQQGGGVLPLLPLSGLDGSADQARNRAPSSDSAPKAKDGAKP